VTPPRTWLYHGFGTRTADQDPHGMFVPVETFAQQLQHLLDSGWRPVDLDGWLAALDGRPTPARSFLLTMDDGYLSVLEDAAPLLARHGVPAVLFALAERVGGTSDWMPQMPSEPLLTADQLRALARHGVEIGLHGADHAPLRDRSPDELHRQTTAAADRLHQVVGYPPRAFAYPWGVHDRAAVRAVADAGLAAGFSIRGRNVDDGGTDRRFAAQRFDVNPTDTLRSFRLKASCVWPAASAAAARAPRLRAAVHRLVGSAR
jgi:peptidoglycan/xylan/chitin deacetylase (PgdA/CDA1 family)